jgi:NAD(P)-dependent dehydrogenase (short-subunit alcohol dehydrogenase family)
VSFDRSLKYGVGQMTGAAIGTAVGLATLHICSDAADALPRLDLATLVTAGLAQLLAENGIRANFVAPGPIWTPLIPSTMPPERVKSFGSQVPMKRAGQSPELASAYVMLASDAIALTGGKPII